MSVALALFILAMPIAIAATVGWAAHRGNVLRYPTDQSDYETYRAGHDLDAIRSRFEQHPAWPSAGASGERR
ncbi:hypothetical protein M2272_003002 [Mycobacterium frederiksbergense]|uniref:DUF2510 domain-containing protein n=1 Tax=Mycolicibacterium frederiksbergense TaxID=117567 RepID=A0ABT6L0A0_9MYCO|nr:hypothetical protein [Mycolicibacterium frederiksbergense]MDH6196359.1 hypothetical protein [Mycolicibacterium frederiksbergense]